ncbi:hypothetical protein A3B02_00050 [Candidatus Roizmanbacteria bacterium RIFCSPLOWO2_01_FULL_42_14]|uniref:HTH cro/C1-type domain-containing protein n=4 Tax=Candidatus Roizmaniibacteriota TaxID=1752723 RepID=A0A1F7K1A3_9BACT|nr:MAG: hypothetical protein A3D08_03340 [Candidatus Roizmanbacteria bacterium RIFCSPHIGHO2_02_FULL_43_11]OGK38856.1 MAG: hypothetical protein A3F32_02635 [Candidatus Roizmanbacteria bacterium RIFCSPHIGHO2_12_FULL_42_10]OGK52515.1 MAG: hypothetical protein A3B02_00050 [Candidatus Roizmanbacteria bacterium RIFCSPLOWO2_01_FULL_42_14]OGK61633.1 MAG: hypothetical protein A3I56_04910 [Candidatus Roizmanbacteria bacterium RIFCSPLOWO2_02_FULL_43_10]
MITNIGQLLKRERERQGISLEQVEKETHIRQISLIALEEEQWEHFPSRTYIQGAIKRYGAFLGLDEEKLIAYFRREYEKHEKIRFKRKTVASQFVPQRARIMRLLIALIIMAFGSFFGYQTYLYLKPPKVIILEPQRTIFKREDKITVKGTAPKETIIKINGRQAYLDDKNVFQLNVALPDEKNKVVIEATGANGRKTIIEKEYLRER